MSESVVERLVKTNPDMEVWWDSSPLIFERWVTRMVDSAPPGEKAEREAQLREREKQLDREIQIIKRAVRKKGRRQR